MRRSGLKRLLVGVGVLVALVVVVVAALLLALSTSVVERAVVARLSAITEERLGLAFAAESLRLRPLSGQLEVEAPRLGSAEAPFVTAERLGARVRLLSLVTGRPRLDSLELLRPVVDLERAPPAAPDAESAAAPLEELPLAIERLAIVAGSVRGRVERAAFRLDRIELEAGFDGRRLDIRELGTRVRLEPAGGEAVELELTARGDAGLDGRAEIAKLRLEGTGLWLEAAGRVSPRLEENRGELSLGLDPGALFDGHPSGPIVVSATADLGAWKGEATLETAAQPAALLSPFLAPELAARLELDSTRLDLAAQLQLADSRALTGDVRIGVVREESVLALELAPRLLLVEGLPASVAAELSLLPRSDGQRRLRAELTAERATDLDSWRFEDGELELDEPRAELLARRLAAMYPLLLDPASLAAVPALGRLSGGGAVTGAVLDPQVDLAFELRPPGGGAIALTATGAALSGPLRLETSGERLALGGFTEAVDGLVEWRAAATLPGFTEVRLEAVAREFETAEAPLADELRLALSGNSERLAWRLDALPAGGGRVTADGGVTPRLPLESLTANLDWETADERAPRVAGELDLAGGVLAADLRAPLEGRGELTLEARMPLASLAALPPLTALAEAPLARRGGPIVAGWSGPRAEWSGLLPAPWSERLQELALGTSGSLSFDPGCPACSVAEATLESPAFAVAGRRAAAPEGLRLRLADGRLRIEPFLLTGDGLRLEAAGELELDPAWRLGDELEALALDLRGELGGQLDSAWLEALPVEIVTPGSVELAATLSGSVAAPVASLQLSAPDLRLAAGARPDLVFGGAAARLSLAAGTLELEAARLSVGPALLTGSGSARLAAPLSAAEGVVEVVSGVPVIEGLRLPFTLQDGLLEISGGEVATESGGGSLELSAPVDARAGGQIDLSWSLPAVDWSPLFDRLGVADAPQTLELASRGELTLFPDQPAASRGSVFLGPIRAVARERQSVIEPGVRVELRKAELVVSPFVLTSRDESFTFQAAARLDSGWRLGDAVASLLGDFRLEGDGRVSAALLDPFLGGGRGEGALGLEIALAGDSLDDYDGSVAIDGADATLLYRAPYLTRIERPRLDLRLRDGRVVIEEGAAVLNEGTLAFSGVAWDSGAIDLSLAVEEAYFRLDYGLVATLGADLRYRGGGDGRTELSGRIVVERGSLTRDLRLDLGLVNQLLAPLDLATTEDDPLQLVALDLAVSTREGVRVKNNLGDLLARWEPLRVTGSLAQPVIEGRIEVDSGGLLYAYGQTVRLDTAVIEYPGVVGADPRLELEVTTSLEDPTIGQLSGADPFREDRSESGDTSVGAATVTEGLATYYGDQIAERLGESVGFRLSLRPLLIFGEADPGARLTIGRDLSPQLSVAASVDLREAEGQTYLVELHELPQLPRLVAQAFTNDQSAYGAALLQRQSFGGAKAEVDDDLPRISKLVFEPPPGVSRRGIKRALELEKGDRFDERQRFVSEVALVDYLAGRGYPAARIRLTATPDARRAGRVRLEVAIRPGPRVRFVFEGDKPSPAAQELIVSLYRPDFFEAESVEEVRTETVRALRSRGYLEPSVEVEVETSGSAGDERRVLVRAEGGVRISPEPPDFTGVPEAVAEALTGVFANAVKRVELAVGLPSADRLLLQALADRGYPEAQILNRYQSLKERVLTVEIDAGPRRQVTAVEIRGAERVPEVTADELASLLTVREGEALERPELSRSALAIERRLSALGYLEARVRTEVIEAADDPYSPAVRFEIEPGARARLAEVDFSGLRSSRESWARNVIELEEGQALGRGDLAEARRRLWRTGVFSGVAAESLELDAEARRVVFELEESPRYRLAYGIRWDSEEGEGAVVDATDSNFLGRAWTLGLRAFYSDRERSLRGLTRIPRVFGGKGSLELFAALREERETVFDVIFGSSEAIEDIRELTLQYSHPVGRHTTLRAYGRYRETVRELPFITDEFKNPLLGLQYLYDSRVPLPLAERGVFASVDLSGSDSALGGDLAYLRLFTQLSTFQPFGGERFNWSQSLRVGAADAFDQLLVRDVRFFAGGEYSVRGYAAESLGPQRRFGSIVEPAGGAALLILNQELRWRALADLALVLFADAGDVYAETDDFGSSLRTSLGLGLRYESPVGLLRLDLAHALDRRPDIDPEFKLYFGLGTAF